MYGAAALKLGEEGWKKVRNDLIEELHRNESHYIDRGWSANIIHEYYHVLNWFADRAPSNYWFSVPSFGFMAATWYERVIVRISASVSYTMTPLLMGPYDNFEDKVIIGLLTSFEHFVHVHFKKPVALPLIHPEWWGYANSRARAWKDFLQSRIEQWNFVVPYVVQENRSEVEHVELE